jgi:hypothetical protein
MSSTEKGGRRLVFDLVAGFALGAVAFPLLYLLSGDGSAMATNFASGMTTAMLATMVGFPLLVRPWRNWRRRRRNARALAELKLESRHGRFEGLDVEVQAERIVSIDTVLFIGLDADRLDQALSFRSVEVLGRLGGFEAREDLRRFLEYGRVERGKMVIPLESREDAVEWLPRLRAAKRLAKVFEEAADKSPGEMAYEMARWEQDVALRRAAAIEWANAPRPDRTPERVKALLESIDPIVRLLAAKAAKSLPSSHRRGGGSPQTWVQGP